MPPKPSFNVEASNYQLLSLNCVQTDALCVYQQLTGTRYTSATSRAWPHVQRCCSHPSVPLRCQLNTCLQLWKDRLMRQQHVFCDYPSFPISTRLKQLALWFSAGTFASVCPASGPCREQWQRQCERCPCGHGAQQPSFCSSSSSGELPISQQEAPRCRFTLHEVPLHEAQPSLQSCRGRISWPAGHAARHIHCQGFFCPGDNGGLMRRWSAACLVMGKQC